MLTLGSLFDGIGGFPLAAMRVGIKPVWASEIEEVPMSITKRHFPQMRHLGDITKICGGEIEPVDVITFGSPCQDLSVAGKRAGLGGGRSGLFLEAVRIIREMREATGGLYPTFAVWENVPGAFTSNKGEDFRTVAEEIARAAQPEISVIRPKKWPNAGTVVGKGHSLAWRLLDARYWGVPQRRRRIFLVADFAGERAGEILFKPESLRRDFEEGGRARQNASAYVTAGTGGAGGGQDLHGLIVLNDQGGNSLNVESADIAPTLRAETHGNLPVVCTYTATSFGQYAEGVGTLKASGGDLGGGSETIVAFLARSLGLRRLTPTECERIQGFPDDWTAWGDCGAGGVKISDTQRYRALGNSVAVPCVEFVLGGIATCHPH